MHKFMQGIVTEVHELQGLPEVEVSALQKQFGRNLFEFEFSRKPLHILRDTVTEPMFLMLLAACILYFILGETAEGIMMLVAMAIVVSISLYQEVRSSNALAALQEFTAQKVIVIRAGRQQTIPSADLVPGDVMLLEEGMPVPADAIVLQENDLSVNESVITGESVPVEKNETEGHNILYQGTSVNSGKCIAKVTATGNNTVLGKLGKTVAVYTPPKTLLQQQINRFVKLLALFGVGGFLIVFTVNYSNHHQFIASLLRSHWPCQPCPKKYLLLFPHSWRWGRIN
jgi:Ca2+-transporting ATPase